MNLRHAPTEEVAPLHQAPDGVYYVRAAHTFTSPSGTVRWSPGQELRVAPRTETDGDEVTLTDGRNTVRMAQADVTRDMDDAAALRQVDYSNQTNQSNARLLAAQQQQATRQPDTDRIVPGHFHPSTLDAPTVRTNLPENIVSTAGAPVIYPVYQTSRTVVIERAAQPTVVRSVVIVPQRALPPRSTPPPAVNRN